jgi:hypothetical protein
LTDSKLVGLPLSSTIFLFVNNSLHSKEKGVFSGVATKLTMSALIALLEAYVLSLWYDFIVYSPLTVPKAVHVNLQYMTFSYVQIFQLIFIKSF